MQPKTSRLGSGRKWLWTAACLFLLVLLVIMVSLLSLYTTGHSEEEKPLGHLYITVENFSNHDFKTVRRFNGSWISDREFIYHRENDTFIYNVDTFIISELVYGSRPGAKLVGEKEAISPDKKYLLIKYVNNSEVSYYAYHRISGEEILLLPENMTSEETRLFWGKKGTQLLFTYQGNIYYKANLQAGPVQITQEAKDKEITYHVFRPTHLSNDGEMLIYKMMNNSLVGESAYISYGSYTNKSNVYPQVVRHRNTRPGFNISITTMWAVNLTSYETTEILPPPESRSKNLNPEYAVWAGTDSFVARWTNRFLNYGVLALCNKGTTWKCHTIHKEERKHGWLDANWWWGKDILLDPDDESCFTLSPLKEGSSGTYKHIAKINLKTKSRKFLTSGKYDVTDLITVDPFHKILYYVATREGHPGERHLYSVRHGKDSTCHTCDGPCLYSYNIFSEDRPLYYARECFGPGVPKVELYRTMDHNLMRVWEDNGKFQDDFAKILMPVVHNLRVPLKSGYEAKVRLFVPPSLRHGHRYPMVIETYGGPRFQEVDEQFYIGWGHYLATAKSYVYATMDTRGSGFQTEELMFEMHKRLGTVEIEDRIAVTEHLIDTVDFIDPERIAIWGHSYGGYATSMVLASNSNVIKCGIALAPVSNWRYYNQRYVEKYLGSPHENEIGFEKANLLNKVENMRGKKFLLVHGLGDDNVNFQHAAMLIKALVDKGILFRTMVYPDADHTLNMYPKQKLHLLRLKEEFLEEECFNQESSSQLNGF